jgi:outer membrane immunogenic protein
VFGAEGDIAWTGIKDNGACGAAFSCQTSNDWLGTVRGRVGYSWDRFLPYVTGGVAFGNVDADRTGFSGVSDTNAGWTIGGGVEGVIVGKWTAKVEYLYVDLGDVNCTVASCGVVSNVDLRVNTVRAGLNYRF